VPYRTGSDCRARGRQNVDSAPHLTGSVLVWLLDSRVMVTVDPVHQPSHSFSSVECAATSLFPAYPVLKRGEFDDPRKNLRLLGRNVREKGLRSVRYKKGGLPV